MNDGPLLSVEGSGGMGRTAFDKMGARALAATALREPSTPAAAITRRPVKGPSRKDERRPRGPTWLRWKPL